MNTIRSLVKLAMEEDKLDGIEKYIVAKGKIKLDDKISKENIDQLTEALDELTSKMEETEEPAQEETTNEPDQIEEKGPDKTEEKEPDKIEEKEPKDTMEDIETDVQDLNKDLSQVEPNETIEIVKKLMEMVMSLLKAKPAIERKKKKAFSKAEVKKLMDIYINAAIDMIADDQKPSWWEKKKYDISDEEGMKSQGFELLPDKQLLSDTELINLDSGEKVKFGDLPQEQQGELQAKVSREGIWKAPESEQQYRNQNEDKKESKNEVDESKEEVKEDVEKNDQEDTQEEDSAQTKEDETNPEKPEPDMDAKEHDEKIGQEVDQALQKKNLKQVMKALGDVIHKEFGTKKGLKDNISKILQDNKDKWIDAGVTVRDVLKNIMGQLVTHVKIASNVQDLIIKVANRFKGEHHEIF